ncbi:MAG: hypothetical protein HY304_09755, partial [candidate division Zixibacteria bacterium]|nr:hypothetical protein [candidate division Zixibacteria bacterium]
SMDFAVFGESTAIRKVTQFGAQSKVEYPNVIFGGRTDDLTGHFHLSGAIPTSILYDPKGQEKARWIGSLYIDDLAKIKSYVS